MPNIKPMPLETRKKISEANKGQIPWMKGKQHTPEAKAKLSIAGKGRVVSEATRKKISIGSTGKKLSEATRQKIKEARSRQVSSGMKGRHHSPETLMKLSKALKGLNVGVRHTAEHNAKVSAAKKGKKFSEYHKQKLSEAAFNRFTDVSERKKVGDSRRGKPGRVYTEEDRRKQSERFKGRPVSLECRLKISKSLTGRYRGPESPSWKGGKKPYCYKFNYRRREAVREFFGRMCICSGEDERDHPVKLSVHHIYHDKEEGCNGKPFNLVPMTHNHHGREIFFEKEYRDYINKTLNEGFKWGIWNKEEYIKKVMYDE